MARAADGSMTTCHTVDTALAGASGRAALGALFFVEGPRAALAHRKPRKPLAFFGWAAVVRRSMFVRLSIA